MTSDNGKMAVEIYGETYYMKDNGDNSKVLQIVDYVDHMMSKIGERNGGKLSYKQVAVLAALNIAEEYHKLQDKYDQLIVALNEDKHN